MFYAVPMLALIIMIAGKRAWRTAPFWALAAIATLLSVETLVDRLVHLQLRESVGYGDGYVFATVAGLDKSAIIYPPIPRSDGAPVLYSPLLYYCLWLGTKASPSHFPLLGPRLLELASYLGALAVSMWLARQLIPLRSAAAWTALWLASMTCTRPWILQLRADFAGIFFALASTSLLLAWHGTRRGFLPFAAGAAAGLAFHFKITFLAAAAAGLIWLLWAGYRKAAAQFAATAAMLSLGGYALFALTEPGMLPNMLSIANVPKTWVGLTDIARTFLLQPLFLLGLCGLPIVLAALRHFPRGKWALLSLHFLFATAIAALSILQAGANANYFYESLFLLGPVITWAAFRLYHDRPGIAPAYTCLLLLFFIAYPRPFDFPRLFREQWSAIQERNLRHDLLRELCRNFSALSFDQDLNPLTTYRELPEPYIMNHRHLAGSQDFSALIQRIERRRYDFIVAFPPEAKFRGYPLMAAPVGAAISRHYIRHCESGSFFIWLPPEPKPELVARLGGPVCSAFDSPEPRRN